jgi:hypothetical protein
MRKRIIALALSAVLGASLGPAAAQASVAGQVAGAVVVTAISSALAARKKPKLVECTLFDRDGNPVTVSCPADVAEASQKTNLAKAPPPTPVHAAPLPELGAPPAADGDVRVTYHSGGLPEARCLKCVSPEPPPPPPVHYAPPPVHYAPPAPDCCARTPVYRQEYRDESVYQPRSVASYLSASGGQTEIIHHPPRVVAVYESYSESTERYSGYYESSSQGSRYSGSGYGYGGYGYGFEGGVGQGPGFHPYGGVGFSQGGYAEGGARYRPRVAGRDPQGFLTWPGKR